MALPAKPLIVTGRANLAIPEPPARTGAAKCGDCPAHVHFVTKPALLRAASDGYSGMVARAEGARRDTPLIDAITPAAAADHGAKPACA
jgi:hypothetical protein